MGVAGPERLLLGIIREGEGIAAQVLRAVPASLGEICGELQAQVV
jgi:Clp amino terminal domain, pathogenicity island component